MSCTTTSGLQLHRSCSNASKDREIIAFKVGSCTVQFNSVVLLVKSFCWYLLSGFVFLSLFIMLLSALYLLSALPMNSGWYPSVVNYGLGCSREVFTGVSLKVLLPSRNSNWTHRTAFLYSFFINLIPGLWGFHNNPIKSAAVLLDVQIP